MYVVTFDGIASGAVVGTYKTMAIIKAANTAGHRGRLRAIVLGFNDEAAQDINMALRIARTNNAGDGTGTAQTPAQLDPGMRATDLTAKINLTAEPTTYESTFLFEGGLNSRGAFSFAWPVDKAPLWGINQALGLLVSPGEAVAVKMAGALYFEQY